MCKKWLYLQNKKQAWKCVDADVYVKDSLQGSFDTYNCGIDPIKEIVMWL